MHCNPAGWEEEFYMNFWITIQNTPWIYCDKVEMIGLFAINVVAKYVPLIIEI